MAQMFCLEIEFLIEFSIEYPTNTDSAKLIS